MMTITGPQIIKAIIETLQMVSISLALGSLLGIPLGILLVITKNGGIVKNKAIFSILNNIINIRSFTTIYNFTCSNCSIYKIYSWNIHWN